MRQLPQEGISKKAASPNHQALGFSVECRQCHNLDSWRVPASARIGGEDDNSAVSHQFSDVREDKRLPDD